MEKIQKINRRKQEMESKLNMRAKQGISNTGITLVALVVTIIVLLILAGVSINLVAGSNGLLNKATKAVDVTNMAKIKEDIELKIAEMQMDYYSDSSLRNQYANVNEYIKAELEKGVELPNGAEISCDTTGKLSYEGVEIGTLNPDGSVSIDGELSGSQIVTKYTVSYNANGGQGGPASKKYESGESVIVDFTTKPTKKGANFLGWARSSTATTPEYTTSGSFSMGTQNVTLYAVWEAWPLATESVSATNYGDKVNYTANGLKEWKIFYNDGTNIFLWSDNYAQVNSLTLAEGIQTNGLYDVKSNERNTFVSWLNNTNYWKKFAEGQSGSIAYGAPTKEMFINSYNAKFGTSHSTELGSSDVATLANKILPWVQPSSSEASITWLASASSALEVSVWYVNTTGSVYDWGCDHDGVGVRPLVKLPAGAKMNWNGTAWDLSE